MALRIGHKRKVPSTGWVGCFEPEEVILACHVSTSRWVTELASYGMDVLPFVLRETRTVELPTNSGSGCSTEATQMVRHQLIGGYCYIHGLADGQGLEIAEKEGVMPEKICLV